MTRLPSPDTGLEPLFVSTAEAARLLGVSRQRIYDLMNADLLEARRDGRRRLVDYASLRRYAEGLPAGRNG